MSGPRTGREALLAELLGDMDDLITRMDDCVSKVQSLNELSIDSFKAAADAIDSRMIGRIDDFVSVANETLVRFNDKTKEIQSNIQAINSSPSKQELKEVSKKSSRSLDAFSFLLGAIVLAVGCLCGLLIR